MATQIEVTKKIDTYDGQLILDQEDLYGTEENLLQSTVYDSVTHQLLRILYYFPSGSLKRDQEYAPINGIATLLTATNYDEKLGIIKSQELFDTNGNLFQTKQYTYDPEVPQPKQTDLVRIDFFDQFGIDQRIEHYTFGALLYYEILKYSMSVNTEVDTYDPNNNLISVVKNQYSGTILVLKQEFDNANNLIRETAYDTSGNKTREDSYAGGKLANHTTYKKVDGQLFVDQNISYAYDTNNQKVLTYYSAGLITRTELYDANNNLLSYELYTYTVNLPTKIEGFLPDGTKTHVILQEFFPLGVMSRQSWLDPNLKPLKTFIFNPSGTLAEKDNYTYDTNGVLLFITRINANDNTTIEVLNFDNKGVITSKVEYASGVPSTETDFTYTFDSSLSQYLPATSTHYIYFADGNKHRDLYEEFDKLGYITLKENYDPQSQQLITRRTYEYTTRNLKDLLADQVKTLINKLLNNAIDNLFAADDTALQNSKIFVQNELAATDLNAVTNSVLNCVQSSLGIDLSTLTPELLYTKQIKDQILKCTNTNVQPVFQNIILAVNNTDLTSLFGTQGYLAYKSAVDSVTSDIAVLKFPDPPADQSPWTPIHFLPPNVYDPIKEVLEGLRTALGDVMQIVRLASDITSNAFKLLEIKFDLLNQAVSKFITEIQGIIDALTATGISGMYLLPKQRSIAGMFADFTKSFSGGTGTQISNETRFIPHFKQNDFITGFSMFFVAPSPSEIIKSFKRMMSLFGVPTWLKDVLKVEFFAEVNYKTIKDAVSQNGKAVVTWTHISSPHQINITIATRDDPTSVRQIIRNYSKPSKEWQTSFEFFFQPATMYRISVSAKSVTTNSEGREILNPIKTVGITFETPSRQNEFGQIKDAFTNWSKLVKKNYFTGPVGNGFWFSFSFDSIFPDAFQLKQYFMRFMDKLNNLYSSYKVPADKVIAAIDKKQSEIFSSVTDLLVKIDQFIQAFEFDLDSPVYYKWITPQVGGNLKYIKLITDTTGIHPEQISAASYTGGFFIVAGGPTLDGIIQTWNILRKFLLLEDPEEKALIKNTQADVQKIKDVASTFNQIKFVG